MKTFNRICAASIAAILAIGSPALAETISKDPSAPSTSDPNRDDTGKLLLGVDISAAGGTPQRVQSFMASLSPAQRNGVEASCGFAVANAAATNPNVMIFCNNLLGVQGTAGIFTPDDGSNPAVAAR